MTGRQKAVSPSPSPPTPPTSLSSADDHLQPRSPCANVALLPPAMGRNLQTWVDLTRRRGWRPSGWAGQGGGHSEGRSRLRWLGNAVGGRTHREGWGMGLADGHVISEYGSPGAWKGTEKRSNIRTDERRRDEEELSYLLSYLSA